MLVFRHAAAFRRGHWKVGFMPRRSINQLGSQEPISQIFLAAHKQLRPNKNGNLYLQVDLTDRSGSIAARLWNASESEFRNFEDGDFVHVEGTTQIYQGGLQLIATSISKAREDEVDMADFMPLSPVELDRLASRLAELLRGVRDPQLRNLVECFLSDDDFMAQFTKAPAGIKNHHAYPGGLLEHVVNLMEVVRLIAPRYPAVDTDLLLVGVLVHDMGKIAELSFEKSFAYTDEGQLIGHVVQGVGLLDQKLRQTEALSGEEFPAELALRLKHMIVSHHGQYEYGSPKLPMTLEAVALHLLDNLDAKLHSFEQLIRDDSSAESAWTAYQPSLTRKLFKGAKHSG
ncbi:MAG TPA: HD domain-containing protein [Pirellulales bacterium]|jgi:3'-5' exoribonuclease|nr:HD domain-containing protein [Pirellulales bacterium]